jgi:hypothetical protein
MIGEAQPDARKVGNRKPDRLAGWMRISSRVARMRAAHADHLRRPARSASSVKNSPANLHRLISFTHLYSILQFESPERIPLFARRAQGFGVSCFN